MPNVPGLLTNQETNALLAPSPPTELVGERHVPLSSRSEQSSLDKSPCVNELHQSTGPVCPATACTEIGNTTLDCPALRRACGSAEPRVGMRIA